MNGDVDGPVPGLSRPPLPPKSRPINRSRKQREREVPDVDWERRCNISRPPNADALVCCIEEHDGAFEIAADVATLIGRVFALYCAYSVQLGDPKHKIDVDPQAWTALLTVNFVVCGAGLRFPDGSARSEINNTSPRGGREGVPALSARFGPSVRVRNRAVRGQTARTSSRLNARCR
ncbi:Small nuclear RNA activating complex (SNAPc), subunit SNAP43 [Phytophthora cactorum]|nr:Small nuclear RNA activating complex (SNAPc), subunit SNAP43 [Phytophthora cactorum]